MNTIKFSSIYDLKKETSNVEIYNINEILLGNKTYKYYSNAQLSIIIDKICNGNCWFCVNNYDESFCDSKETCDEEYFYYTKRALSLLKNKGIKVTITGGEPTKSNRLIKLLRLLKEEGYGIRTFSTNGTGLFDRVENKTICTHLLENGVLKNIDISRMGIDDKNNRDIMKIEQTNDFIRRIFRFGNINSMDMRLSCVLQKDGIKNLSDILKFNDFYTSLGVNTSIFRELLPIQDSLYNEKVIGIDKIFDEIEKNKDFNYIRTLDGMYYIVKVYRYKDKLVKCYSEKSMFENNFNSDIIREFVLYPDGNLYSGWNKSNNLLLKAE